MARLMSGQLANVGLWAPIGLNSSNWRICRTSTCPRPKEPWAKHHIPARLVSVALRERSMFPASRQASEGNDDDVYR